jgi:hypothetical protein
MTSQQERNDTIYGRGSEGKNANKHDSSTVEKREESSDVE